MNIFTLYLQSKTSQFSSFKLNCIYILLLIILLPLSSHAQQRASISGYIIDSHSSDPIPGALISIKGNLQTAFADSKGYFELENLIEGDIILDISSSGYSLVQKSFILKSGENINQIGRAHV